MQSCQPSAHHFLSFNVSGLSTTPFPWGSGRLHTSRFHRLMYYIITELLVLACLMLFNFRLSPQLPHFRKQTLLTVLPTSNECYRVKVLPNSLNKSSFRQAANLLRPTTNLMLCK